MIKIIKALADKGFHIFVNPTKYTNTWVYYAGVYVNNERRAEWIEGEKGLPKACCATYEEAFKRVVEYCKNYKIKKVKLKNL